MKLLDSTGKRLGASFGLVLALMLAVAGASWFALDQNRRASDRMVNAYLPLLFEMERLQNAHLRVSVLVRDIASTTDYSVQKQSIAALKEQTRVIDEAIECAAAEVGGGGCGGQARHGGGHREQGEDQRRARARARPDQDRAVRRGLARGLRGASPGAIGGFREARSRAGACW